MALRRNSRPYPFKSFQGRLPSTEDVRKELEDAVKYIQEGIDGITFSNIGGQIETDQAILITDEIASVVTAYTAADEALATRITSTDAIIENPRTGLAAAHARITQETQARASLTNAFAYTVSVVTAMVGGASASVVAEASARATADGFLEGKYTLTVTAGNVVTGMNITSSTGAGTNISSVIFRATDFLIYNSVSGVAMFVVSGTAIKLGSTLTVDTVNSKIYIGSGTFNNSSTAFYVDSTGQFSLKDKLSWDGTTLSINGNITSVSGTIGGFTLATNSLSANSGVDKIQLASSATTPFLRFGTLSGSRSTYMDNSQFIVQSSTASTIAYIGGTTYGQVILKDTATSYQMDFHTDNGTIQMYNSAGTNTIILSTFTGIITAPSFSGSGASLTSLNATSISSGTLANARLPTSISVASLTATSTMNLTTSAANAIFDTGNGTVNFRHAINNATSRANWGTTTNHSVEVFTNNNSVWFFGSDGHFKTVGGDIRKVTNDGWSPKVNDGTNTIEFQASGGQIFGRINGGAAILLG